MRNYLKLSSHKPRTRKDMIEFLVDHPWHNDNWDRPCHFARNIKMHRIDTLLPMEMMLCWDKLDTPWDFTGVTFVLREFEVRNPGSVIISAGRQGGHLELHSARGDYCVHIGSIYKYQDWELADVRELVNLVWDFDKTCQIAVDTFVQYAIGKATKEEVA